ncbi:ABC transporter substrate-binding protein [Tessaracoccus palaemonis]|uniref:ABC transporter substrate-binding protein n=1 Tax=Tessaracoccus palaemonis TaxID=2829499 RepID=A0ABX8SFC2_9ACTN|nr:ABC transporter substrate-binding protein [Tessaracoccus palaemonis]QXT62097.1 ABC transporter substrate-binding protein [Tessaracoccus palaemonis]
MINRRLPALAVAAALAVAPLTACSAGPEPEASASAVDLTPVTVGLSYIPNVQFSAFYVGVEQGIFEDLGLDVTLRHHGEQEDVFGALLGGQEDVVFASADEAMVAAAAGQDLQTFATSYQRFPAEVMTDRAIEGATLADLKGHTLGIPGHYGSSYYAALAAIHQAGLTEDDVTLQDIGYTQLSALAADQVDFIVGFHNNELVQLQATGGDVTSIPVSDPDSPTLVGPSLVSSGDSLSDETLAALAEGMKQAEQAVIDDPEAALDATAEQVPALAEAEQRAVAEKVLAATTELWLKDGTVDVTVDTDAFAAMGEFLTQAGIIDQAPAEPYRIV